MKIITKRPDGSIRVQTLNDKPSKTDPSWQQEVDANHILKKFKATGQVSHLAKKQGVYADVSDVTDLHEGMMRLKKAQLEFNALPLNIRKEFDFSFEKMVSFLNDPKNDAKAVELGLKAWKESTDPSTPAGGPAKKPAASNSEAGASKETNVSENA